MYKCKNRVVIFFIFCSVLFVNSAFSQFKVGGYIGKDKNIETYLFSGYTINNKFNLELRLKTNNLVNSPSLEFLTGYNFVRKNYYQLGVGVGINFTPFNSGDNLKAFLFPVNLEVIPFKKHKFLSFSVEPSLVSYLEKELYLRLLFGVKIRL